MYTTHYNILRIYLLCTDLTAPWLEPSGAGVSRAVATLSQALCEFHFIFFAASLTPSQDSSNPNTHTLLLQPRQRDTSTSPRFDQAMYRIIQIRHFRSIFGVIIATTIPLPVIITHVAVEPAISPASHQVLAQSTENLQPTSLQHEPCRLLRRIARLKILLGLWV